MTTSAPPVRERLLDLASRLLLGPLDPCEVLSAGPADTYLTGILWPRGARPEVAEDETLAATDGDVAEDDSGVPGYRAIRPCSIGLTFACDVDRPIRVSLGSTARYERAEQEAEEGGGQTIVWRRRVLDYTVILAPGPAGDHRITAYQTSAGDPVVDPSVVLHVRRRHQGARQAVTLTLINDAAESEDAHRDALCLFQTEIVVETDGGESAGFHPRSEPLPAGADEDAASAALLYRDVVEYAVGHGVAADWRIATDGPSRVATSWMPQATVEGVSSDGHADLQDVLTTWPHVLDGAWLGGDAPREEALSALEAFAACYSAWVERELEERVETFGGVLREAADRHLADCRSAARRIHQGVVSLGRTDAAWQAFQLANAAMDRQARFAAKKTRRGPLRWRPFQLAYMLLVLPGIVDPADRFRDHVDLLWFPTGGGKTEAYLGLTAFQIFHRRLTSDTRRRRGGVDVLMRYTLRLLTVQQFQRAASLITACEMIRDETPALGTSPVSLGLYVGGEATPNRDADARTALAAEHSGAAPRSTPRQLLDCPVCGEELPASAYSAGLNGIDIVCSNVGCDTHGRPLPVQTVDDYILASPPSLLIGTIDKFAQLPRKREIRALFGAAEEPGPGLIIQDELHLISGPLGSVAGLYETAVDLLCSRDGVRPKVIGSTATIGQAARQVRALFDRDVLQFPPPGFEARDSFFAVRDPALADRRYVGLCTAGRSPKFGLQAVAAALLQAAWTLVDSGVSRDDVDPYWTLVLYFNSLRELGGAHVLMQDDVPRQMEFLKSRLGGSARRLEDAIVELSSRVNSRDLPAELRALETSLSDAADPWAPRPRDVVLASNMISVGVDVSRLGLMLVNGQPKATAEYIQATSRVGRQTDGLVFTVYNSSRPRDISHFEHFSAYHGALYRNVEATSVTPWAPRARDKALHAVLAALVRHLVPGMDHDEDAVRFNPDDEEARRLYEWIAARAASASSGIEGPEARQDLRDLIGQWGRRSRDARAAGTALLYWERKAPYGRTRPHLMSSAEEGARSRQQSWPTPNSMREVEPSTAFILKTFGRRRP